jgi:hypothetical protein
MATEKRYRKVKPVSIVLTISLLINVVLLVLMADLFPVKKALKTANKELTEQLKTATNEISRYKGISVQIDNVIRDAELKIQRKEKEISRLLRSKKLQADENTRLINEIDSLKELYLTSIDSLLIEREQTQILNNTLESMNETMDALRNQLGLARELITDNLEVKGKKVNNQGKKQSTALAKKTDQLAVCFDIIPNRVTSEGMKTIFIVVTSPDGTIIKDIELNEDVFWHPEYKKDAELSKTDIINYQKQKMSFCSSITPDQKLIPGLYVVEIFSKDNKLGMSTFSLR